MFYSISGFIELDSYYETNCGSDYGGSEDSCFD